MDYIENGVIYEIEEVETDNQTAVISRSIGYEKEIRLTSDKEVFSSDGVEKVTIVAKLYNYLNEYQVSFSDWITFAVDGEIFEVLAENGQANITLTSDIQGEVKVTAFAEKVQTGELVVVAE